MAQRAVSRLQHLLRQASHRQGTMAMRASEPKTAIQHEGSAQPNKQRWHSEGQAARRTAQ